ncbi:LppP/LprE family lipoprotein [Nocardia blacklockiae]|uniref:LppP/LprE family lipoprotein n=1 Tax=Nocardia blacklockiae TaxID=480036 RepID=UPI0018951DF6|nr:LppP/LprE family lipoprotein [Nocardia blacklockiae]MBF6170738.1 LppP/LprE family lipoprotein [Nocardia blacklockiae]
MLRTIAVAATAVAAVGALTACQASGSPGEPTSAASSSPSAPPLRCGVDLAAPAVRAAVAGLPPEPATQAPWATDPATFRGNFDPCATLSTAIVTIAGATGSSPEHALLFHRGTYLGTATEKARGFTSLAAAATTDDTVVLDYKTPGSCNACPDGTHTQVEFHWDGQRVVMKGNPPG